MLGVMMMQARLHYLAGHGAASRVGPPVTRYSTGGKIWASLERASTLSAILHRVFVAHSRKKFIS